MSRKAGEAQSTLRTCECFVGALRCLDSILPTGSCPTKWLQFSRYPEAVSGKPAQIELPLLAAPVESSLSGVLAVLLGFTHCPSAGIDSCLTCCSSLLTQALVQNK